MERESQNVIYVVKIQASYHVSVFEFKDSKEAVEFMSTVVLHNVKDEDEVTILMKVKREGEESER